MCRNPLEGAGSTDAGNQVVRITPTATSNTSGATNANGASASGTDASGANGDSDSSASLSGGAIAGIVIGVVGGLALIAVAVFFLFRRRRNRAGPVEEVGGAGTTAQAAEKQDPDVYEAPESPHYQAGELYAAPPHAPSELPPNHRYVAELGPGERSELPSNYHGHELR